MGVTPPSLGWGTPRQQDGVSLLQIPGEDRGYPQLEQHGVYLLRSEQYASCVHAGILSCLCTKVAGLLWFHYTLVCTEPLIDGQTYSVQG